MSPDAVLSRLRNTLIAGAAVAAAAGAAIVMRPASPDTHLAGADIDLTRVPFADAFGLTGPATVSGDLRIPFGAAGRDLSRATGELAMSCDGCTIDYDPHVAGIHVGPLAIDRLDARVVVDEGKLSIASWQLASRDLRLEVALDLQLAPHLEDSPVSGCLRFGPTAALRARNPHLASLLETTGGARDADGLYDIRLAGTLAAPKKIGEACGGGRPAASELDAAIADGVASTGVDSYEIRRSLVERVVADPMAVARTVRVVPAIADGRPCGFKLYAIRPGSLLDRLGFRNGDTIVTINGFDLTAPDKALEAYTRLRQATSLEVAIRRHGEARTMHYTIGG